MVPPFEQKNFAAPLKLNLIGPPVPIMIFLRQHLEGASFRTRPSDLLEYEEGDTMPQLRQRMAVHEHAAQQDSLFPSSVVVSNGLQDHRIVGVCIPPQ